MTLGHARVVKNAFGPPSSDAATVQRSAAGEVLARRVAAPVLDAREEAAAIVTAARGEAGAILAEARAAVAGIAETAAREARETELARVSAELLVERASEESKAEREIDRTIALATLLAERVVGEALTLDPSRIAALAAEALKEARGARRVRLEACAADAAALEAALAQIGEGIATVEINDDLGRGSLVVHTELGRVDGRLAPQLARLAEALRQAMREENRDGSKRSAAG